VRHNNKDQNGFLALEAILSLALAAIFIFGVVELVFSNQEMTTDAENSASGLALARSGMEQAEARGFGFVPPADAISGGFTEHLETKWLADYAKLVTSRASFVSLGKPEASELTSLVTDPQNALGRDSCALDFSGNWRNPALRGSLSLGAGNPATDIDARGGKIYLAANGSIASMEDFFAVDAGDPDRPVKLKGLNTGPGLNALQVAGDYAFAANSSINGQLQIIKISDPANPTVMLNVKFMDAGSGGVGNSIFYGGNRVYVGTLKNSGPEFYVYDAANPLAPRFLGEFEIGSQVNKIYAFGDYAYLATADADRLLILNVSDPARIFEAGSFSDVGGTAQSGESLATLGGRMVLGRAGGLPNAHIPELYLLDVSRPESVVNLDSADANMSVNDIFLRGGMAFLATNKSGRELQIYGVSSGRLQSLSSAPLSGAAVSIDCDGEIFFLATDGDPALQIVSAGAN
jgi:LVIVD repeat